MDGLIKLIFLLVQKPTIVFHLPKKQFQHFFVRTSRPFFESELSTKTKLNFSIPGLD